MAHWRALLWGSSVDLVALCGNSPFDDTSIARDGDGYYLYPPGFDSEVSGEDVLSASRRILNIINGLMRVSDRAYRPAEVRSVEFVHDDGSIDYYELDGVVTARVAVSGTETFNASAAQDRSNHITPILAHALDRDAILERALRLYGKLPQDWTNLNRVYEIVRDHAGGDDRLRELGWASKSMTQRFRRTANHPAVSGDAARHGVMNTQPPADPITLS